MIVAKKELGTLVLEVRMESDKIEEVMDSLIEKLMEGGVTNWEVRERFVDKEGKLMDQIKVIRQEGKKLTVKYDM